MLPNFGLQVGHCPISELGELLNIKDQKVAKSIQNITNTFLHAQQITKLHFLSRIPLPHDRNDRLVRTVRDRTNGTYSSGRSKDRIDAFDSSPGRLDAASF